MTLHAYLDDKTRTTIHKRISKEKNYSYWHNHLDK